MNQLRFDTKVRSGPTAVIIGRRGCGKSFLVRDILHHIPDTPSGAVAIIQYPCKIKHELRQDISYVFIFQDSYINNRKHIWENYGSMFESYEMFSFFMDSCVDNHGCLVIVYNSTSKKLEDNVFWYKAQEYDDTPLENNELLFKDWSST